MPRKMRDAAFREQQRSGIYDSHVRPVNELVDRLRDQDERGWLPHVAPWHGGVEARVLSVLRDPGPKTLDEGGSGLLCIENDDPTAERQADLFAKVGVAPRDVTPWNAYPWYINAAPSSAQRTIGVDPLLAVLDLMPLARVVFLQGGDAQDTWKRLVRMHPEVASRDLEVVRTYHPSRTAERHPDAEVRRARIESRCQAYRDVAHHLGIPAPQP